MNIQQELEKRLRAGHRVKQLLDNPDWPEFINTARRALFDMWCQTNSEEDRNTIWATQNGLVVLEVVMKGLKYKAEEHEARGSREKH